MRLRAILCVTALATPLIASAQTDTPIVNDTFADGNRTSTGADGTGIDSAWFAASAATLTVPAAGDLRGTVGASSSFWLTYFPSSVTLVNPGDTLKVSLTFTMAGDASANTSQNLGIAVANSPTKVTGDGTFPSQAYSGYANFVNVAPTLGAASSLREWTLAGSGVLLGTSGNYGANGTGGANLSTMGTANNTGFAASTTYNYTMTLELDPTVANQLDVTTSITGGSLNNTGTETTTVNDASPNSLTYNTFAIRPGTSSASSSEYDIRQFQVDLITAAPEPSTIAIGALGALGLGWSFRRARGKK